MPAPQPQSAPQQAPQSRGFVGDMLDAAASNPVVQSVASEFTKDVAGGPWTTGVPSPIRVGMEIVGRMTGHPEVGSVQQAPMGSIPGDQSGVEQGMANLGIGRQPGESTAALTARYEQARQTAIQNAQTNQQQNTVGAYDGDPVHMAERFGQQALNTGAGIVANPQYLAGPEMAVGPNAAARIGSAFAGNAAIGSTSDAAAQLMDMAQDQKKNFDVQQNLQATMMSGAFGGAMHGAVEVAPHVASMFANRGVDTLPAADPRTSNITPMTQDHVALNQADHAQYQQLMQTGSVDDIKGFFQGRQGPQPSWTDVNDWVQHRDNPPAAVNGQAGPDQSRQPDFNYAEQYNQHAEQQHNEQNRQAVEDHVNGVMAGWKNAPNVEVVHGPQDIADPAQRQQAMANDRPGGEAPGAPGFYGSDGITRMYSGRISTPDQANALLFHEGLGHNGLAQQFGDKLDSVLTNLLGRNVNQFSRDTDAWQKANPNAYGGDRIRAAEEVLAERSEKGPLPKSLGDAIQHTVMQFGRKMGFKLSYTDGEVSHILAMAHDSVINGKPDARANGFNSSGNRYMFTGPHAQDFDPEKAFIPSDSHPRNEINDVNAKLTPGYTQGIKDHMAWKPQTLKLGDVLDHPELYKNYPELKNMHFSFFDDERYHGQYHPDGPLGPEISVNPKTDAHLPTVLHEVQHAIQDKEGYPDFENAKYSGGTGSENGQYTYDTHPSEIEARATEGRIGMSDHQRSTLAPPKFMRSVETDAMGYDKQNPEELDMVDRLKQDPRYWSDPEYRANINELARTRFPPDGPVNKFMRAFAAGPKDVAQEAYDRLNDGYEPSTHSWEDSMEAAKNTALDLGKLKSVRSAGNLDQRLFQYDGAAKALNDKLMGAAQKVANGEELTADEHADQLQSIAQFHYVLGRIENDSAQIGRALNAMKALDFSRSNLLNLRQALEDSGSTLAGLSDSDTMDKFLRQYQLLGNAKGGQTLARDLTKPGWEKYALSLYRNMLLSGLGTHIKAPMDMSTGIALDLEDRLGAIPIGKIHDALQAIGLTKQGGMHGREPLGYLFGAMKAIHDGTAWTNAMAVLKDPHSQTLRMTKEAPAVLPGVAGQVTSIPTRLISAQDAFFRAISTNAHLYGEGVARSLREGGNLTWSDHLNRGVSYGQNPNDAMQRTAIANANKALLLSENPLTNFLERGKKIVGHSTPDFLDRALTAVIDLFTPIIRVPANSLLSRVIARSPASMLDPETRKMFMAGGRQADIALSRTLVGTLKLAMMWGAADVAGNYLTGNKRKEAEATGWRSNSIAENGGFETGNQLAASMWPTDLHNSTATMVQDIHEAWNDGANQGNTGVAFKLASSRLMKDMYSQLWTGDISNAMGMFSDSPADSGSATRVIGAPIAATAVPAAVSQFRSFTDPDERDTSVPGSISGSIENQIINRVPGLSNTLPTRYSVYGDPLKTGSSILGMHNWITGGNHVPETTDPAELELDRLNKTIPNALITPVLRTVPVNGTSMKLSPSQFEQYQQRAGQNIVNAVRDEMQTPEWGNYTDKQRIVRVRQIQTDQKLQAREDLFGQ